MNTAAIQHWFADRVANDPAQAIQPEWAITPQIAGTPLFDQPLVCVAAADDPLFRKIQQDEKALGPTLRLPTDWLPGAKSVISIFYPFSQQVRRSNWDNLDLPSPEWLHGRVEGHEYIHAVDQEFESLLRAEGHRTIIPALSPELVIRKRSPEEAVGRPMFVSSWSERHAAFASGLGTFGLCTHLITAAGKAGRYGSIITTAELEPTPRPYGDDPFAYCTFCGQCARHCPVDALSLEGGKDFQTCWVYMEETKIRFKPRYGCGKCQLQVPCETGIPNPKYR